jgi:site-specific recombinase XerD
MRPPVQSLEPIFDAHIRVLATTLRPRTLQQYRASARRFLTYLHAAFPQVHKLSQLRRVPHLLGWFRWLCEQDPPLCNKTREGHLLRLRRMFQDLADNGHHLQPSLIRRQDLPPTSLYLPRPLSPEEDQWLDHELRRSDDLESNALLLLRATGIRIGEGIDLPLDCLRQLNQNQWALHVPLGKLHTERLVPVDEDTRHIVTRILALRALAPAYRLAKSHGFLLPRRGGYDGLYRTLHQALADAARRAGCTGPVSPHRLRHSYATCMLRLGVSLPVLMQLLGHKDIRMTLRYVQVTQQDLQREFHRARQNTAQLHSIPKLPVPPTTAPLHADLLTVRGAIAATRHLLEMFRLQLEDEQGRRKLRRLTQRLLNISRELDRLTVPKNERTLAGQRADIGMVESRSALASRRNRSNACGS